MQQKAFCKSVAKTPKITANMKGRPFKLHIIDRLTISSCNHSNLLHSTALNSLCLGHFFLAESSYNSFTQLGWLSSHIRAVVCVFMLVLILNIYH